ncbi:hypothetical protein [Pseudomonas fluorescens]|uniref:hypothetical protein n=1 Tax=Pseudomonas fluorescens TaxID=294 RepID=UPI001CD1EF21|nr:hypothetical protein [Pseudomonas fluorescens]
MKLIQCRFSSGQRVPLLVQTGDAAPLPILVPFIYVQLKLRHGAYNTGATHPSRDPGFYIYAKTRDLDIDEAILAATLTRFWLCWIVTPSDSKAACRPIIWSSESAH